jgi:hypothetical protein
VSSSQPSIVSDLRTSGFALSLSAMAVPMLQLVEQRVITPLIGVVRAKGGNPLALLAAAYMLWASLPTRCAARLEAPQAARLSAAHACHLTYLTCTAVRRARLRDAKGAARVRCIGG